jgi:hypothetical protein
MEVIARINAIPAETIRVFFIKFNPISPESNSDSKSPAGTVNGK